MVCSCNTRRRVDRAGVDFLRDGFTRLHFTVRTAPGTRVAYTNAEIEAKCAGAAFLARESCIRNQCGDAKFAKASMCERRLRGQGADPAVTTN